MLERAFLVSFFCNFLVFLKNKKWWLRPPLEKARFRPYACKMGDSKTIFDSFESRSQFDCPPITYMRGTKSLFFWFENIQFVCQIFVAQPEFLGQSFTLYVLFFLINHQINFITLIWIKRENPKKAHVGTIFSEFYSPKALWPDFTDSIENKYLHYSSSCFI